MPETIAAPPNFGALPFIQQGVIPLELRLVGAVRAVLDRLGVATTLEAYQSAVADERICRHALTLLLASMPEYPTDRALSQMQYIVAECSRFVDMAYGDQAALRPEQIDIVRRLRVGYGQLVEGADKLIARDMARFSNQRARHVIFDYIFAEKPYYLVLWPFATMKRTVWMDNWLRTSEASPGRVLEKTLRPTPPAWQEVVDQLLARHSVLYVSDPWGHHELGNAVPISFESDQRWMTMIVPLVMGAERIVFFVGDAASEGPAGLEFEQALLRTLAADGKAIAVVGGTEANLTTEAAGEEPRDASAALGVRNTLQLDREWHSELARMLHDVATS